MAKKIRKGKNIAQCARPTGIPAAACDFLYSKRSPGSFALAAFLLYHERGRCESDEVQLTFDGDGSAWREDFEILHTAGTLVEMVWPEADQQLKMLAAVVFSPPLWNKWERGHPRLVPKDELSRSYEYTTVHVKIDWEGLEGFVNKTRDSWCRDTVNDRVINSL